MKQQRRMKIGLQEQAQKPIYLYENGNVVCGNFTYTGRYKEHYKEIFKQIASILELNDFIEYDVSNFQFWTAIDIYNEIILKKWQKTISSKKIYDMALQSQVVKMIEEIQIEFKHAVAAKWKQIFKKADIEDPLCPKKAWQIL